jgi:hypothetical protein
VKQLEVAYVRTHDNTIQLFCVKQSLGFSLLCGCGKSFTGTVLFFSKNMGNKLSEQSINIYFLVTVEKNFTNI